MPSTTAKPRTTARIKYETSTSIGAPAGDNSRSIDESSKEHHSSALAEINQRRVSVVVAVLLVLSVLQALSYYSRAPTEVRIQAFNTVVPKVKITASTSSKKAQETASEASKKRLEKRLRKDDTSSNVTSEVALFPTKPPARKLKVPYPIFVASFSKSGTTSTFSAFSCYLGLEYVAHRWTSDVRKGGRPELIGRCIEQNVDEHLPPFEGCGVNRYNKTQTVVWTDTAYIGGPKGCYNPNIAAMDAIWDAYPHATLLLVRRNATAWFHSANTKRASFIPKWANKKCSDMPNSRNESDWVNFYQHHTQNIRAFAEKRKSQMTYIEVELESPDTGRILQEQIGLPESCWKHCQSSFAQQTCIDLHKKHEQEKKNGR